MFLTWFSRDESRYSEEGGETHRHLSLMNSPRLQLRRHMHIGNLDIRGDNLVRVVVTQFPVCVRNTLSAFHRRFGAVF